MFLTYEVPDTIEYLDKELPCENHCKNLAVYWMSGVCPVSGKTRDVFLCGACIALVRTYLLMMPEDQCNVCFEFRHVGNIIVKSIK